MVTDYFRKMRVFFARNYHQHVRMDGEKAMDTLMGTMIGVLFLAVISASFAGIFMAYTVSSAKATENNERNNAVVRHSTNTLNNLYIESASGNTTATAAGWTVKSHRKALSATVGLNPNAAFSSYTFAATRTLVAGGTTPVSQWGKNEAGIVTIYTALPKAGSSASKCDWTEAPDKLESLCIVAIDKVQSVVSPPVGVKDEKAVRWEEYVNKSVWTATTSDWSDATKRDVTTRKLGTFNTNGVRTFKYVVMFENLQPGKKVSLDFEESLNGSVNSRSFTPTLEAGETGNVSRSNHGSINLPEGVTSVTVYLDTDVAQSNTPSDPTVKMSRFVIYNLK